MSQPERKVEPAIPTPRERGETTAAELGDREWVLDTEDLPIASAEPPPELDRQQDESAIPMAEAVVEPEVPPSPLQIIEAMLFIGGLPLQPERTCEIIRGLRNEQFRESIEMLNRVYRMQNRPYFVAASDQGFTLTLRPRYRSIKEKIFGGPREARLTQPALDVLAMVAYRQPAAKAEIDSVRGGESGHLLRQLVRLGLISVVQRAEAKQREVSYGTTQRFLELFNLNSLEDLPQTGDPQRW
jgi:segregation and condensation protein B